MEPVRRAEPGLFETLRDLLASLLGHVRLRVELFGLEVQQEKERLVQAALFGALAALFCTITLLLAALAVVAAYWDTPARMTAIVSILVVAALAAVLTGIIAVFKIREPSTLFHASLSELVQDEAMLEGPPVGHPHAS